MGSLFLIVYHLSQEFYRILGLPPQANLHIPPNPCIIEISVSSPYVYKGEDYQWQRSILPTARLRAIVPVPPSVLPHVRQVLVPQAPRALQALHDRQALVLQAALPVPQVPVPQAAVLHRALRSVVPRLRAAAPPATAAPLSARRSPRAASMHSSHWPSC